MPQIKIPTPLRAYTNNEAKVDATGATVAEALSSLVAQYPELEQHLFSEGKLRNFVNVFLDDEDIRFLDGVDTELEADDNLRIIPSIAGGC
ncbi:MAG: ubiquitin-like small modifier protein 1 [Phototrophicaceae bacterium]